MAETLIPLGKDAKLYYAKAGLAPVTEMCGVRDLTLSLEKDDVDATRRCSGGWEDARQSTKRLRISFDLVNASDSADETAAIAALKAAYDGVYLAATGIAFKISSSIANDNLTADFLVTKFERGEPLGDIQTYSIEARMTQIQGRTPAWS